MTDLERQLHDALDTAANDVVISPDAWQQNQRRRADDRSRRAGRRMRVAAGVASAAALVLVVSVAVSQLGGSSGNGLPGQSDDDPTSPENRVGKTVLLETFDDHGSPTEHTAYLTRAGGKGLSFCNEFSATSSGSGSCTSGEPVGSDSPRSIAYLTSSSSGADPEQRSVAGAVDQRVTSVQAWFSDGTEKVVPLHALGVDGLQAFGTTVLGDDPVAQRLVGYDSRGAVAFADDLRKRFGEEWLPESTTCNTSDNVREFRDVNTSIEIAATKANFVQEGTGTGRTICMPLDATLQGARAGDHAVVLLVAPEVDRVELRHGSREGSNYSPEDVATDTIWKVVVVRSGRAIADGDELVAYDAKGNLLDNLLVISLT